MPVLLASGNPLGLRAVGSGGRTAVSSYDQITRTLRQRLGPEYAQLFAEPNNRGAVIDWYADVEHGTPQRLLDLPSEARNSGLGTLERLVADVDGLAQSLQKSDRQDERILGDMLQQALEIPDESAVYLIDGQPVMTSWGYIRDQGRPSLSPLRSLLRRRVVASASPPRPGAKVNEAPEVGARPLATATLPPDRRRSNFTMVALWSLLTLLLLASGVQLLRGCAIGFPISITGRFLDFCPAGNGPQDAVAAEAAKQAELQSEYDELVRRSALKRQACVLERPKRDTRERDAIRDDTKPRPKPGPDVGPDTVPNPKDQMTLPKDRSKNFLEGCWRAHEGLFESRGGKSTGNKIKVTMCFNKDGTGSQTVRYVSDNAKCVGPISAAWDGDLLKIEMQPASCESSHGSFAAATATCHRGEEGVAKCDEIATNTGEKNFTNFPFTRTNEEP